MADANRMTLGEIVDFCEAYNERQQQREKAERAAERKQKRQQKQGQKRKATAEDYRAWFGG